MKTEDLTEEQRLEFTEEFYLLAPSWLNDQDTPHPWGCPWLWAKGMELYGETPKEMARDMFNDCIGEIEKLQDIWEARNGQSTRNQP